MQSRSNQQPHLENIHRTFEQLGYRLQRELRDLRFYQHHDHPTLGLFIDYRSLLTFADLDLLLERNGIDSNVFYA